MHEVLDLCVGCKGCARDCPSEVDMAKLKAEVEHEHHRRHGASLRDRLFRDVHRLSALGSALAPLSNWTTKLPGSRWLLEKTVGIARERSLPTFHRETLTDWFAARGPGVAPEDADRAVLLFPDTHTNYSNPSAGKAAVRVLESAGVRVEMADGVTASGRAAHSKGFLETARERARRNVDALAPAVDDGRDVVVLEPSDSVMLQQEYLDLLSGADVEAVAANSYGLFEYLDVHRLVADLPVNGDGEHLTYHGHCHQKATTKDHHAVGVLRRAGYRVDPLDSGCCGMAGSFGYEAEHVSMSRAIGSLLFDQVDAADGETVVAPGASCRTQLGDHYDRTPPHPVEKLAGTLPDGP
jgi:Fe-S oxidoreductase